MTHQMKLHPEPFFKTKNGEKTVEMRLYDEKRRRIKIGDTIVFTNRECPEQSLQAKVISLHRFASFEELYAALPLTKCGYTEEIAPYADPNDMARYYSAEEQQRFGALGIEFVLI